MSVVSAGATASSGAAPPSRTSRCLHGCAHGCCCGFLWMCLFQGFLSFFNALGVPGVFAPVLAAAATGGTLGGARGASGASGERGTGMGR